MAIISLIIHGKNGLIKRKGLLPIIVPAIFAAVVAGLFASATAGDILKKAFGGFLVIVSVVTFINAVKSKSCRGKDKKRENAR